MPMFKPRYFNRCASLLPIVMACFFIEQAPAENIGIVINELKLEAAQRTQVLPCTLVFSRSQMKYWNNRSYGHVYKDRPLFVNRAVGGDLNGYRSTLELVAKYDIDGLAFFPQTYDRMKRFAMTDQAQVMGIKILPEFTDGTVDDYEEVIQEALQTTSVPRINGKVLISSYGAQNRSPQAWGEILTELRERQGDSFLFLPALLHGVSLQSLYQEGTLARNDINEVKAYLREYLDVCDGIYFNYPPALRLPDRTFDRTFFEEVLIPVYKAVLAEPPYQNKLLGMAAYKAHMMPERGHTLHEDGTRTLRNSFEPSLEAEADVIILPEWDEFNENTCWSPTLYNGTAPMRIVRYYMSRIRKKFPTPVPGDDLTIPNLIVSTRKRVTLGENLIVELLNVPDTTNSSAYTAELELQDETGAIVYRFPPETFDTATLHEVRHHFPTETTPRTRALIPVVTVKNFHNGPDLIYNEGLQPIQIRTTFNDNYLYVKQALRNTLRPLQVSLTWAGENTITGAIQSLEPLALVELVADDREVYAVDPLDEFQRNNPDRVSVLLDYSSFQNTTLKGTVTVHHASASWQVWGGVALRYIDPVHPPIGTESTTLTVSENREQICFSLPRADIDQAEISFDFSEITFRAHLREVFETGMMACAKGTNGVFLTLAPYDGQFNIPQHLEQNEANFHVTVSPQTPDELYVMRVTTKSGEMFRSRPLLRPLLSPIQAPLRVFSESHAAGITVTTDAVRVPDIEYIFTPGNGAVLRANAGRPFWGALGGPVAAVTGKGNVTGIFRDIDFLKQAKTGFAPIWCQEDGRTCLRFDGQQTVLKLPQEVLPSRGAFTVEMEIKPESSKDQYLLATRILTRQKGLALEIRNGQLHGSFRAKDWRTYNFPTGLNVPAGHWSTIRVIYDFATIRFSVNKVEGSFPLSLPGCNLGYVTIGDGGWLNSNARRFDGTLRALRIRHSAGPATIFSKGQSSPFASGGDHVYTTEANRLHYRVHEFLAGTTNTFTVHKPGQIEYLIVAGGGGGGRGISVNVSKVCSGGGGGAGGFVTGKIDVANARWNVIVGGGGDPGGPATGYQGGDGSDTSVFGVFAIGGGGGGAGIENFIFGRSGGSGGGGGGYYTAPTNSRAGGAGVPGQGHSGGTGTSSSTPIAASGGGAGEPGMNGGPDVAEATDGGDGLPSCISGEEHWYAGGGGGGRQTAKLPHGKGGKGGGGEGGGYTTGFATDGLPNTGGGGGGGSRYYSAGAGGSGLVILRYPISQTFVFLVQ